MATFLHLVKRGLGSISSAPPSEEDMERVRDILLPGELPYWLSMQGRDQRHSVVVLDRFLSRRPFASRAEMSAALLHDVGKGASTLGLLGRIIATLVGPATIQMRLYLEHERLGSEMLTGVSDKDTLDLLNGSVISDAREDLLWADEI